MHAKIEKLRKLKLLFVEDEQDILDIISDTLTGLKVDFFVAKDGAIGLELFKNNSDISVVVSDINMPVMNGLDMIREIRKLDSNVPCIIMSAHTEQEFKDEAQELNVTEYMIKPFDFIKFLDIINKI